LTVDFVVCTLAVEKKKSGQVSTCRIGPFPCQLHTVNLLVRLLRYFSAGGMGTLRGMREESERYVNTSEMSAF
jgi:hypothetical protein